MEKKSFSNEIFFFNFPGFDRISGSKRSIPECKFTRFSKIAVLTKFQNNEKVLNILFTILTKNSVLYLKYLQKVAINILKNDLLNSWL